MRPKNNRIFEVSSSGSRLLRLFFFLEAGDAESWWKSPAQSPLDCKMLYTSQSVPCPVPTLTKNLTCTLVDPYVSAPQSRAGWGDFGATYCSSTHHSVPRHTAAGLAHGFPPSAAQAFPLCAVKVLWLALSPPSLGSSPPPSPYLPH